MSKVYEIADAYVEKLAKLDPVSATMLGIAGHDTEMTDFSPEGAEALNTLRKETLAALEQAPTKDELTRIARECMEEELTVGVEQYDAGEHLRSLNVLHSPLQHIRMCFDLMPQGTEEQWRNIAARLRLVSRGLASYRATVLEGVKRSLTASRRQVLECANQTDIWCGQKGGGSFFDGLLAAYDATGLSNDALRLDLERSEESPLMVNLSHQERVT